MKRLLAFIVLLLPMPLIAQHSELIQQLEALKQQVGEVAGEKESYSQQISYDAASPYRLEIVVEEVDNKGRSVEQRAVLNLGLLDKNLVRRDNSRDLMWVSAQSGGMPVIKMYEDGVIDDYTDELALYSKGVDNARAIEEILEAAIPLAEAAWQKSISLPTGLPALRQWISEHVTHVDAGDVTFKQAIEPDDQHPARVWLTIEEYNEKGLEKSERFGWNFGDLHLPSIKMDIHDTEVTVEADIRQNQDFISVEEDGELQGFSNALVFYAEDADQAQLLVQALHDIIPLARTASEKMLPQPSSLKEGLQWLNQQVKNFAVNPEKYEQSLTTSSAATYTRRGTNDKGRSEEKFTFDLSDLNAQAIAIEAANQWLVVEVPVKEKQSLVEVWEDGEQQHYTDQVAFFVPDLPTAKRLQHLLRYVIEASSGEVAPHDFAWLKTSLASFDEAQLGLSQMLETREGEQCKVSYTTRRESNKKAEEHMYEFNLYDIDPEQLSLDVRGKTVAVTLPTHFGEEIIKDYENGDDINYTNEVSVVVPNIETGKIVMATFQEIVQDCSKE